MNSDKETVLFELIYDTTEAQKSTIALTSNLALLRKEKAATITEFQKGAISEKEYTDSLRSITSQIDKAEKEYKDLSKAIADNKKLQDEQVGSLKSLGVQAGFLKDQLSGMTKAQLDSKGGKAMIAQYGAIKKAMADHDETINKSTKSYSDIIKEQTIFGVNIGDTIKGLKSGGESFGTLSKGIFSSKGALVALGAVPIIFFLTGLVAFLKSTDEGADKLAQGVAYLTTAFDTLVKGIAPAGKLLVDIFTAPVETVKKLVKGTDEYTVSLDKVVAAANRAGLAQAEYTKTMQDVEDAENALIVQREKAGLKVDQALLKVKDRSLSERERIKILNEAGNAEQKLSEQTKKNATDAYNAIAKLNKEKATSRALTDDEAKAEMEAEAKMIGAQRESLNTQQTIQNRRSALLEQEAAERKANADKELESRKKAAQERIFEAEIRLIQARRLGQETLAIEEEIIRKTGAAELIGLAKNSQERKLIQAKVEQDIADLKLHKYIETNARLLDLQESQIKTILANVKAGTLAELEINKALIDTEASRQKDQVRQTIQNKELQDARIKQIDAETKRKLIDADKAYLAAQIQLGQQRAELQQQVATSLLNRFNSDQKTRIGIEQDTAATLLAKSKEGSRAESDARIAIIRANQKAETQALAESGLQGTAFKIKQNRIDADADREAADERINQRNKELDAIQARAQQITSVVGQIMDAQSQARLKQIDEQSKAELNSAGLSAEMREKIQERYDKKREEAEKDAAAKRKRMAVIDAIISTAVGVAKAIPNPFLIALAAATGVAQIATIEAQQFARGGVVDGPSHAGGGVKYMGGRVELEGGEGVINKRSMELPWVREQASRLNQVGGGVAFGGSSARSVPWTPSYKAYMQYGGIVPNQSVNSGPSFEQVRRMIESMPRPVVSVVEIAAATNQRNKVEAGADY